MHTGSIYDERVREYLQGGVLCPNSDDVYIIKTNNVGTSVNKDVCRHVGVKNINYTKAVLLIRNPYSAIASEYNRQSRNKTAAFKSARKYNKM